MGQFNSSIFCFGEEIEKVFKRKLNIKIVFFCSFAWANLMISYETILNGFSLLNMQMSSNRNERKKESIQWMKMHNDVGKWWFHVFFHRTIRCHGIMQINCYCQTKRKCAPKMLGYNSKNDYASFTQHLFSFFQLAAWQCTRFVTPFQNVLKTQNWLSFVHRFYEHTCCVHISKDSSTEE